MSTYRTPHAFPRPLPQAGAVITSASDADRGVDQRHQPGCQDERNQQPIAWAERGGVVGIGGVVPDRMRSRRPPARADIAFDLGDVPIAMLVDIMNRLFDQALMVAVGEPPAAKSTESLEVVAPLGIAIVGRPHHRRGRPPCGEQCCRAVYAVEQPEHQRRRGERDEVSHRMPDNGEICRSRKANGRARGGAFPDPSARSTCPTAIRPGLDSVLWYGR